MLGVNAGPDPLPELQSFLNAFQISFPVLIDDGGLVYEQYRQPGQSPFPLDYVIDQDGTVAYAATEYDPDAIMAAVDELLGAVTAAVDTPTLSGSLRAVPNPFNPRTELRFAVPVEGPVWLTLYDLRGRVVRRLSAGATRRAGGHVSVWDGRFDDGRAAPSGIYVARLRTTTGTIHHKLTLIR